MARSFWGLNFVPISFFNFFIFYLDITWFLKALLLGYMSWGKEGISIILTLVPVVFELKCGPVLYLGKCKKDRRKMPFFGHQCG
uniref:Uncharacterized protein n=1 Tax=Rhizophora mucronata TaxID=61149 RepID=A0A2P2JDE1_RHIMU